MLKGFSILLKLGILILTAFFSSEPRQLWPPWSYELLHREVLFSHYIGSCFLFFSPYVGKQKKEGASPRFAPPPIKRDCGLCYSGEFCHSDYMKSESAFCYDTESTSPPKQGEGQSLKKDMWKFLKIMLPTGNHPVDIWVTERIDSPTTKSSEQQERRFPPSKNTMFFGTELLRDSFLSLKSKTAIVIQKSIVSTMRWKRAVLRQSFFRFQVPQHEENKCEKEVISMTDFRKTAGIRQQLMGDF